LFVSSQIGYPKPAPQFFRAVGAVLKLPSDQILLVGDDPTNDLLGATSCGWQATLLCRQGTHEAGDLCSLSQLSDLVPAPRC
jgi:FMN phosphatase YigB (HAD superfamily)